MTRQAALGLTLLAAAAGVAGCARESCLLGSCDVAVCEALTYSCDAPALYVGRIGDDPGRLDLASAAGVGQDLLLQNARITLVLDALEEPHGLAPTGGTILDLGPRGGADALSSLYQLAGVLPDDAFAYDELVIEDRAPHHVAVIVRGQLDGRPDIRVATRYELWPCEPGVRVRSELVNRSPDPMTLFVADGAHWGKKNALPFAPQVGQGFEQPELDLLELGELYQDHRYVVARPAVDDGPTYGFVGCDRDTLAGVNDPEISALGSRFELVRPGETVVLERFILALPGGDLEAGVAEVAVARGMLHGDDAPRDVRGRVIAEGLGFGGGLRRAAVLISEDIGGVRRPLTMVVPGEDGRFVARVPSAGRLIAQVWSFGRPLAEAAVDDGGAVADLAISLPGTLAVRVTDSAGAPLLASAVLVPRTRATRRAVGGSWFGRFGDCAPWLGPPHGASPACNRVLVDEAGVELEVPAGEYWVYATAGPDYSLSRQPADLVAGERIEVELAVTRIASRPDGWRSADLHVHGRRSFDSSIPDLDRVRSFVAGGVEVIAATDHDVIGDYDEAIDQLGLADRVLVIGGLETTPLIPFLGVPGEDVPRVVGHFNHWPLAAMPAEPRAGAPWDEMLEPGALLDLIDPLLGGGGVQQLNHPWDEPQFGRDTGYLRAIGFDPRLPVPLADDGTPNGMLLRAPGGRQRNVDFDTMEIQNGPDGRLMTSARPLWFALMAQGFVKPGTASSDSHSLVDNQLGYGRTFCPVGPLADLAPAAFARALREGRCVGGSGVFIAVEVVSDAGVRGLGLEPVALTAGTRLRIEVRAPPWIPVEEVRAVTSRGEVVLAAIPSQPDPLGVAGVIRWTGEVALAELPLAAGDDFVVIEAGMRPFAFADLDDDGVPDTSDNDEDGDVDQDDVEDPDDDSGPLRSPADPRDEDAPLFHATRAVPRLWPYGFAGPLLIDRGGDGWLGPAAAR